MRVTAPQEPKVLETNRHYPIADIVWRDDSYGDRHASGATKMDEGLTRGLIHLQGDRPVYFDIKMSRVHSLTEKAPTAWAHPKGARYEPFDWHHAAPIWRHGGCGSCGR